MSENDDGGPAFPLLDQRYMARGMSLRDWFAGQIAAGMAASSGTLGLAFGPDAIASRAYEIADAMLTERAKS